MKRMLHWMEKEKLALLLCVCLSGSMLLFAGCGGGDANSSAKYTGSYMAENATTTSASDSLYSNYEEAERYDEGSGSENVSENSESSNRKLITTMNISAETTEFDTLLNTVNAKVAALGGYVESSNINVGSSYYEGYGSSRNASMTIRIPAAHLQEFTDLVTENSNITSQSKNVDDVTLSYVDLQSRKNAYKAEEERLLEMMEMAQTIDEMIVIEDKLADVRYHLESMESQLRTFDNQVDYSTVYLNIKEVVRITPPAPQSVGEKIREGFSENLLTVGLGIRDFFVGLIVNLPFIVIWAVIILVIVLIVKAVSAHSKKKQLRKIREQQNANPGYYQAPAGGPFPNTAPAQQIQGNDAGQKDIPKDRNNG